MIKSDTKFQHQEVQTDSCLSNTLFASKAEVETVKNDLLNKVSDLREEFVASSCPPSSLIQTSSGQSSQLPLSASATSRNTNRELNEANSALNSNSDDDQPKTNQKTNRKIVIAGDSLLHRINSRKMTVNKIPSVKLTKRGDNLSGTVSRLTKYISKHSNVHLDIVFMAGTNDLSKRDVTPEVLIKELDDSITIIKRFSNVGQMFLCKIPQRFDHHNINTKVCLFNELLIERFLDTEDFLTVVDTVQPEIKFYYEDGLHLSNLGISKLCGIVLSKLYKIFAPTSHKSRVSARQNRKAFVRGSSSFKQYSGCNSK